MPPKTLARRLGLERLSVGQLHWSAANYAPLQEWALVNGLADCYEKGLVEAVGVSNYGPRQLERVAGELAARGAPLASAQARARAARSRHSCRRRRGPRGPCTTRRRA